MLQHNNEVCLRRKEPVRVSAWQVNMKIQEHNVDFWMSVLISFDNNHKVMTKLCPLTHLD